MTREADRGGRERPRSGRGLLTWRRLKWASFAHSTVYVALLATAITGEADGLKTVLGWAHGLGWIAMSIACLTAVRLRVIPLRLGVAVAVLGGVGPFFGTAEFVRLDRSRRRPAQRGTVEAQWR